MRLAGPIGVFDSGYGGLTVLQELVQRLPQYDFVYLGDNARAPYGNRSFETVFQYTLEAVEWFFREHGCPLVIIACNTASAKALRSIQQRELPKLAPDNRVLGVIRPTAEVIGNYSRSKSIGVMGTKGTVQSGSYPIEIAHFFPKLRITQEACPMWVPLIENDEYQSPGADYFVEQHIRRLFAADPDIDTLLLACTHYPLLMDKIRQFVPPHVQVIAQGDIVAESLADYLQRHPEIENRLTCGTSEAQVRFYTTDTAESFEAGGAAFFRGEVKAIHTDLKP
jgi:glutamate racemase